MRPVAGRRCSGCLAPVVDPSAPDDFHCGACRLRPPAFDRLLAGWFYESPMRDVVVGLKFGRLEYLGEALGQDLATRFRDEIADCAACVPTPLHWTRSFQRGYNQAELIASRVATILGRPLVRRLRRCRSTKAQSGLDRRQRRVNLKDAFHWRGRPASGLPHWLLVDDVFTTGATLDGAARVLKRAGAGRVTALVAAWTPSPEENRSVYPAE